MSSINLKRSVPGFAVVAGLLAAAAPASAQLDPATDGVTTPQTRASVTTSEVFELNTLGGNELAAKGFRLGGGAELTVTSLKADSNEVAVEGFKLPGEPRGGDRPR